MITVTACIRAGLSLSDMSCIESNEACAVSNELGFTAEITNPNGGAIALGYLVGASGAIILIKLIYELRRMGGRYGLATMCIGGGQGIAVIIEKPEHTQDVLTKHADCVRKGTATKSYVSWQQDLTRRPHSSQQLLQE